MPSSCFQAAVNSRIFFPSHSSSMMQTFFETIGAVFSPLLPFVNGQNAAAAITGGILMIVGGALLLGAVAITRFSRTKKKGDR